MSREQYIRQQLANELIAFFAVVGDADDFAVYAAFFNVVNDVLAINFSSSTTTIVTFISFFMPASYCYTCSAVFKVLQAECEFRAVQYFEAYIDVHKAHSLISSEGRSPLSSICRIFSSISRTVCGSNPGPLSITEM